MMRILMPCVALPPFLKGGGPTTALLNAKNLVAAGNEVLVVHAADVAERDVVEGVDVQRIPSPNLYWDYRKPQPAYKKLAWHGLENYNPRAERAMSRIIADFKPDIVYTFSTENVNVGTWRAADKAGVPCLHQACSTFLICWKSSMMRNGKACGGQCTDCYLTSLGKRYLSHLPQGLMGETSFIVEAHRKLGYFSNAKTLVAPGSVSQIDGVKPRQRSAGDMLRVGFLGELSELKAPDLLAKASHMMGGRKVHFSLGGKSIGTYSDQLEAQFAPGSASLLGWTDPATFFETVDVLVLPSRGSEVFGRVLVEAYARGLPVIGSDQGGIPETVEHNRTGFVFASDDHKALANHLMRLHDDVEIYNAMSKQALMKAADYAPEVWQNRTMEFINSIICDYRSAKAAA
ncbi:MAG: glycosyltransferase [Pseudomonadota bacterium]